MDLRGGLRWARTWGDILLPGPEGRRDILAASLNGTVNLGGSQAQLHEPVAVHCG